MKYILIVLLLCFTTAIHAEEKVCEVDRPSIVERVVNRSYPSVFTTWQWGIENDPQSANESRWSYQKRAVSRRDLFWQGSFRAQVGFQYLTPEGSKLVFRGGGEEYVDDVVDQRNQIQALNPDFLFLASFYHYGAHLSDYYPEDWKYWLRDEEGNRIKEVPEQDYSDMLIDYTLPGAEDHFVEMAVSVKACGIFDGIFMDLWAEEEAEIPGTPNTEHLYHGNRVEALVSLVKRIREAVGDEFLIIVNTRTLKIPRSAPYVNGAFIETFDKAYPRERLIEFENALSWYEDNFRYPQINCLNIVKSRSEPWDSPANQQLVRATTTLSLTHSNGYINFTANYNSEQYWYPFWDVPLGQPVGGDETKGQLYQNKNGISIEGLFIREFTNGWAVYNRSGKARTFQLPKAATGVHSDLRKRWHTLPDLDGEIYLKEIIPPDTTRPDVSISVSSDTQDGAFDAVITFTEPVSDFVQQDLSISGTATATIAAWTESADATTYIATITPTTSGTLILKVNENVAADDASNPNTPATQQTLTVQLIPTWDVNRDGQVNVLDLVAVANAFGEDVPDVNGDGIVNILDLVLVAQHFGDSTTAAPSMLAMNAIQGFDAAMVQAWIERAQLENDGSIAFQDAIANLQRLFASLIPEKTALLANYPNPFNPETWIPYQLSESADVTLTIYAVDGTMVRTLVLGHQTIGIYQDKSRAAYWDGKNQVGESVASGVYFYTLTAGDFTATRKLLIRK